MTEFWVSHARPPGTGNFQWVVQTKIKEWARGAARAWPAEVVKTL